MVANWWSKNLQRNRLGSLIKLHPCPIGGIEKEAESKYWPLIKEAIIPKRFALEYIVSVNKKAVYQKLLGYRYTANARGGKIKINIQIARTIFSTIFLASPKSIIVLSR